jgi:hypothetical protein
MARRGIAPDFARPTAARTCACIGRQVQLLRVPQHANCESPITLVAMSVATLAVVAAAVERACSAIDSVGRVAGMFVQCRPGQTGWVTHQAVLLSAPMHAVSSQGASYLLLALGTHFPAWELCSFSTSRTEPTAANSSCWEFKRTVCAAQLPSVAQQHHTADESSRAAWRRIDFLL